MSFLILPLNTIQSNLARVVTASPEAKAIRLKKPSALKRTEPPMSLLKQAWSSQPDGFSLGRLMGELPHD